MKFIAFSFRPVSIIDISDSCFLLFVESHIRKQWSDVRDNIQGIKEAITFDADEN